MFLNFVSIRDKSCDPLLNALASQSGELENRYLLRPLATFFLRPGRPAYLLISYGAASHMRIIPEKDILVRLLQTRNLEGEKMLNWYAIYVKSNHEFIAHDELSRKKIEAFLPTVRKQRQWKDRKKWIDIPIFPGYLFIHVQPSPEDYLNVLRTRGVINLLAAQPGCPTPVSPEEIISLKLVVESGTNVDIYPHLKEGTRVRVRRGPLQGAEGTLEKKDDQYLFLVNIELLGRSIGVRIYADDIEEA